jgi:protein gp37
MAQNSHIEWTEATWNPVTGCDKISPGCKFCYAKRMADRLKAMGSERYRNAFKLSLQPDLVDLPLRWKQPKVIFVNSMSDLFHVKIPDEFIRSVFETMNAAHWHTFQVLTKRSDRLAAIAPSLNWTSNIWMGVSVESPDYTFRIDDLVKVPSAVRFLSVEPFLAPIPRLPLKGIDWVIVGGESGPKSRPMEGEWARQIRNRCVDKEVPFFFKQWGGVNKKRAGRILDGRTWDEMPKPKARPGGTGIRLRRVS